MNTVVRQIQCQIEAIKLKDFRKENFEGFSDYILLINEKGKFATN
jgi:hypothetical protein